MSDENGNGRRSKWDVNTIALVLNFVVISVGGLAAYSTLKVASEINRESQAQFRHVVTEQLKGIHDLLREHETQIRAMQVAMAELKVMRRHDDGSDRTP